MIFRVVVWFLAVTLPAGCCGRIGPLVPAMRRVNETRFVDDEAYLLSFDPTNSICFNERDAMGNPVFSDGSDGRVVPRICQTHGDAQTMSVFRADKSVMPLDSLEFVCIYCWKLQRFRQPVPSSETYWGNGWVFFDPCY